MKKRTFSVRLAFVLSVIVLVIGIVLSLRSQPPTPVREISLILHEKTTAGDVMLQAGAQRAAEEYKVDLSVITLSETGAADEQCRLTERETAGGAQAIVLSAADRTGMGDAVTACREANVPLLTITSGCDEEVDAHLSAEQTEMGKKLAFEVMKRDGQKAVATIVRSAARRTGLDERLAGLIEVLTTCNVEYEVVDASNQDVAGYGFRNRLRQRGTTSVIALDLPELELLCSAQTGDTFSVYGFDTSSAVLAALDSEKIEALCVADDFSLGFLAVQTACALLDEKTPPEALIPFALVDHDTMYDAQNQWLLFSLQR